MLIYSSKDQPLTLQFRDYGTVQSVDSISQNKSSTSTAPMVTADDHSENLPLTIQNSDFHFLKGKVFKLKSSKQQFLSKNQIGQVKCYVDKAPPNNFCFLVLPASPFHTNTFEGIVKRVKSPNSQFFEFKTQDRNVQLDQNEVVGAVIYLDYQFNSMNDPPLIETEDLDTSKIFEYIDSYLN